MGARPASLPLWQLAVGEVDSFTGAEYVKTDTSTCFESSGNVGGKLVFRAKIGGSPQDALERTRRQAHALLGVPRTSMELK